MRAVAKIAVVVFFVVVPLTIYFPLLGYEFAGVCALPIAWYVLFTLPEERAEEYNIIRRLALGPE